MKILVLSGSPKGRFSATLQSVLYLQKLYTDDSFEILDVGAKIKAFEKDFSDAAAKLANAEVILFAYPVYTCIATAQLHRFIELIYENGVDLSGKAATQLTTSKHFYDMTAHKYIEANCYDFKMNYIRGLSADMDDLIKEKGQRELVDFWNFVKYAVSNSLYELPRTITSSKKPLYTAKFGQKLKDKPFTAAVVTNCAEDDLSLKSMLEDFCALAPFNVKVFNVADFHLRGGCLGCLNCAGDGICIYNDGFQDTLRNDIESADTMLYAFTPSHHCMGADFKTFDDRRFCNGHRTKSVGQPTGYIVGGSLKDEINLSEILEGRAEIAGNYLAGIATTDDGAKGIENLAAKLTYALETGYCPPQNYMGVGGRLIFRDLVYKMQGIMRADHKFYKAHGIYGDMPNKDKSTRYAMKIIGVFFNNKKIRKKLGTKLSEGMIMQYVKVLQDLDKK